MEKITHELLLDNKPLDDAIIADWLNGTDMTTNIDLRCTELQEALLKFSLDEIKAMERLDQSERHDQHTDSGDGYQADDQPYIPNVGDECVFSCTAKGKEVVSRAGKLNYISQNTCVMSSKGFDGEFVAHPDAMKFRPLKTERDILIEKACKASEEGQSNKLNVNIDCSAYGRAIIEDLIDAGLIK